MKNNKKDLKRSKIGVQIALSKKTPTYSIKLTLLKEDNKETKKKNRMLLILFSHVCLKDATVVLKRLTSFKGSALAIIRKKK